MRALLVILGVLVGGCSRSPGPTLTVFAAASTADVITQAAAGFEAARHVRVVTSFAGSSDLARQIKGGAPADVFLSADEKWMDELEKGGALAPGSRRDLLGNELVLIAPAKAPFEARAERGFDLPGAMAARAGARPGDTGRIALADPSHVPAGRYARQALEHLGWWGSVEPMVVPAADVRAALRLVEMGEAAAGIVYATDARASKKVVVVLTIPADAHEPIRYPIALTARASPEARQFLEYLASPEGEAIFERAGFRVPAEAPR